MNNFFFIIEAKCHDSYSYQTTKLNCNKTAVKVVIKQK